MREAGPPPCPKVGGPSTACVRVGLRSRRDGTPVVTPPGSRRVGRGRVCGRATASAMMRRRGPEPNARPRRHAGLVAVVTGGGTGIGAATARELARTGARVAICGRRPEPIERVGAELADAGADVLARSRRRRPGARPGAALVDAVLERFGRIDVLVNNAGGQFAAPAEQISSKGWRAVHRLNVDAVWDLTRTVAERSMIPNRGGLGRLRRVQPPARDAVHGPLLVGARGAREPRRRTRDRVEPVRHPRRLRRVRRDRHRGVPRVRRGRRRRGATERCRSAGSGRRRRSARRSRSSPRREGATSPARRSSSTAARTRGGSACRRRANPDRVPRTTGSTFIARG